MNANYMLNTTLSAWDIIVNKERYRQPGRCNCLILVGYLLVRKTPMFLRMFAFLKL